MSGKPFAYAWRWKGGATWKLTLTKNPNAHPDIEVKELFEGCDVTGDRLKAVEAERDQLAQALLALMQTSKAAVAEACALRRNPKEGV